MQTASWEVLIQRVGFVELSVEASEASLAALAVLAAEQRVESSLISSICWLTEHFENIYRRRPVSIRPRFVFTTYITIP